MILFSLKFLSMPRWQQAGLGRGCGVANTWLICLAGTLPQGDLPEHTGSAQCAFLIWWWPFSCCPPFALSRFCLDSSSKRSWLSSDILHSVINDGCWLHLHMAYLIISLPSRDPLTWATDSGAHSAKNHPDLLHMDESQYVLVHLTLGAYVLVHLASGRPKNINTAVSSASPGLCPHVSKQVHHIYSPKPTNLCSFSIT